ncbi:MAG TPA: hypothetical protein VER32_06300 [Pyrinomonadaceae bacterium]|nr:hypothetical protein [Pyrinomonadaceae bacterium]
MVIEDFGARVTSVWQGLRPVTRSLVEQAVAASAAAATHARASYDARSEWELSLLLAALDDRAAEAAAASPLSDEQTRELGRMAETCAFVLGREARSAEVFGQLLERALRAADYARVDAVADAVAARLAPTETCELTRHQNAAVRAIAHEALLQTPVPALVALLGDPVDACVARDALERLASEYESEEARWVVDALEYADPLQDE